MIALDESSDHEIDNIETIHLDESNENEEIEERFRFYLRSPTQNQGQKTYSLILTTHYLF